MDEASWTITKTDSLTWHFPFSPFQNRLPLPNSSTATPSLRSGIDSILLGTLLLLSLSPFSRTSTSWMWLWFPAECPCFTLLVCRKWKRERRGSISRWLTRRFSKLYETISKKPIPPHVEALVVEVSVTDKDDNDPEVPYVRVVIRP